ncbi:MAG: NfeD family protein [Spirochaetales bacterium]|nr:NfeD family protein [Spirochaetales bacterium]
MTPEIFWLILGLILIIAEIFIPGVIVIFFGFGALITALTTTIGLTGDIYLQIIFFAASSLLLLILFRNIIYKRIYKKVPAGNNPDTINLEIGKIVPVEELIEPYEVGGKVRYQGTLWAAKAEERITPGESVRIIGYENLTIVVKKIHKEE